MHCRWCFTGTVEDTIAQKAIKASEAGFGLTRKSLATKIGNICRKMKYKTPFKNDIPGFDWWEGFQKRHPEVALRTPEAQTDSQSRLLNRRVVHSYFQDLGKLIADNGLIVHPAAIWNMDETSCCLEHKPVPVVARKGAKAVPGRTSHSRETFTSLVCINAAGKYIPPMIIAKGKTERSLQSLGTSMGPPGARYTYQERAWMNDELGLRWFTDLFLQNCGTHRPQLIILDSHHSHEALDILEAAQEHGIILLALPPTPHTNYVPLTKLCLNHSRTITTRSALIFCPSIPPIMSPNGIGLNFLEVLLKKLCHNKILSMVFKLVVFSLSTLTFYQTLLFHHQRHLSGPTHWNQSHQ